MSPDVLHKAYAPTLPADPKKTTWDKAVEELIATPGLRPDSIRSYRTVIRVLRSTLPESKGPFDVTPEHAQRFKRLYLTGKTTRSKASDAKAYGRSPSSCRTYLRSLRSLWNRHFKELGYVTSNPWASVSYPAVEKKMVKIPTEEAVAGFGKWLAERYPNWPLIHLFVRVKALAACRTLDLCQIRSDQLRDGRLYFESGQTKTRSERAVPLPADVFLALGRLKGRTYLWEAYTEDARQFRPGTRNRDEFDPRTLYWAISNIFREYNETHPKAKVKPHDLRKRAITLTTLATGSVDATAQAIGIDPQTARRYYLDAQAAFDSEALLRTMADVLDTVGKGR